MHWGYMNQFLQVGENNDVVGLKLKNDEYGYADNCFSKISLASKEYFSMFFGIIIKYFVK
jgi:hypothetical protein